MVLFGYRPVKQGKNWGVLIDPEYAPIVQEMAERYLRHVSLGSIVRWLNSSGVPSPKDVTRMRSSNPKTREKVSHPGPRTPSGASSSPTPSPERSRTPRTSRYGDEQGVIIYRAEPLITRDQFDKIQLRLAQNPVPVCINTSPLTQVAFCAAGALTRRTTGPSRWRTPPSARCLNWPGTGS